MISRRLQSIIITVLGLSLILGLCVLVTGYVDFEVREKKTIDDLGTGRGFFVQTHDARIFLQDIGPRDGPVIIFFHGMGARGELFRPNIDPLVNAGFRVLAFDIPPFGFSEKLIGAENFQTDKQAARIIEALEALHVDRASIICHSIGCRVGIETLLQKPQLFRSAVLAAPVLGFADDRRNIHFQQNASHFVLRSMLAPSAFRDALLGLFATNPVFVKSLFRLFVYDDTCITDERVRMLAEPLSIKGMTRATGDWIENLMLAPDHSRYTNFQNLTTLTHPILIVWGDKDATTPLWQGTALQHTFPHAIMNTIAGGGHMIYVERPNEFNALVLPFLDRYH